MMMSELSGRVRRRSRGKASVGDRLRERLVDGMGLWKARLAYDTAILGRLTASPGQDPTGVERATAALHMYRAAEAIEEFEDALARLDNGHYGTCESCGRPIPMARLEARPQTRFCVSCPPAPDRGLRSRRRRIQLEDIEGCLASDDWLTATRAAIDPGVLAESAARHPSSSRDAHRLEDTASR